MTGMTDLQSLHTQLEETLLACLKTERPIAKLDVEASLTTESDYLTLLSPSKNHDNIIPFLKFLVRGNKSAHQPLYDYLLDTLEILERFLYIDIEIQQQSFLDNPQFNSLFQLSHTVQITLSARFHELQNVLACSSTKSKTISCDEKHYSIKGLNHGWLSAPLPERDLIKQLFTRCNLEHSKATLTSINTRFSELFREHHLQTLNSTIKQLDKEASTINAEIRQLMQSSWNASEINTLSSHAHEFRFFQSKNNMTLDTRYHDYTHYIQDEALKELYIQYHQNRIKKCCAENRLSQQKESMQSKATVPTDESSVKETSVLPSHTSETQTQEDSPNQVPLIIGLAHTGWAMGIWAWDAVTSSMSNEFEFESKGQSAASKSTQAPNNNEYEQQYNDFLSMF